MTTTVSTSIFNTPNHTIASVAMEHLNAKSHGFCLVDAPSFANTRFASKFEFVNFVKNAYNVGELSTPQQAEFNAKIEDILSVYYMHVGQNAGSLGLVVEF